MLAATCGPRSMPTRSISPKTPVFGMPMGRPFTASASSTVRPRSKALLMADCIHMPPMRLAMKPGVSLQPITEFADRSHCLRPRGRPLHHFQQPHVARRVEEMGDEEVAREALAQPFGQRPQRDGRGIGGEDAARLAHFLKLAVQRLLGVQ